MASQLQECTKDNQTKSNVFKWYRHFTVLNNQTFKEFQAIFLFKRDEN